MTEKQKLNTKKRVRQRNRNVVSLCLLVVLIILLGILFAQGRKEEPQNGGSEIGDSSNKGDQENEGKDDESQTGDDNSEDLNDATESMIEVPLEQLDSTSAVLIRREDNEILFEMDADRVLYPASMTKIMTAIVAIENLSNLNDMMKIRQATYDEVYLQGASLAGFPCGVDVPVIDVLYGIMLPSGAECCVAIAEYLYGSEEALVQVMNDKAKELGMNSTHFVTSTGLHDEQHYTTVNDLAKLVQYALENETFKMIYCSKTYTTAPTQKTPDGLTFYNTMFARLGNAGLTIGEILGGKTGFTSEAGTCLASFAMVDGKEYILVTAGSMDESKKGAVKDAVLIYDQIG